MFVRLALKVVMQNYSDFADVILLWFYIGFTDTSAPVRTLNECRPV